MSTGSFRTELKACAAIAGLAVRKRRSEGSLWLTWLLLAWFVVMLALACIWAPQPGGAHVPWIVTAIPFIFLLMLWWPQLALSVMLQYTPTAARLVPRVRQRAMAVMLAAWLAATLVVTALIGIPGGHPVTTFLISGLVLSELTSMQLMRMIVVGVCAQIPSWFGADLPADALNSPGATAILAVLLLWSGRSALRTLFGAEGRLPPARPQPGLPQAALPAGTRAAGRAVLPAFLPELALGPRRSMASQSLSGLVVLGISLAVMTWRMDPFIGIPLLRTAMLALLPGLLALICNFTVHAFYRYRAEQALVRLAPGAPAAREFNRVLARRLLAQFGMAWLVLAVGALALMLLSGAGLREGLRALATFALAPFAAGYLLRDYARPQRTGPLLELLYYVVGLVIVGVAFKAGFGKFGAGEAASFMLVALAASGSFVWLRWRAMVRAPAAFPAGRRG